MSDTINRIHDATIRAKNVVELRAFYNRIGFREVIVRGDDFVVFAAGTSELVLLAVSDQPKAAIGLAFLVDDVASLGERFRAAGVPFEGPIPLRPGMVGLRLADPNGNALEFLQPAVS